MPGKVIAQLMGNANVDTTLNIYTQVLDGSLREAVERVGGCALIDHDTSGDASQQLLFPRVRARIVHQLFTASRIRAVPFQQCGVCRPGTGHVGAP